MNTIFQDIVNAFRTLSRQPRFTSAASLTLALGIGATVAIFTIVNTILIRPLPYANPEGLFVIRLDMPGRQALPGIAAPEVVEFREKSTLIEDIASATPVTASITTAGDMERVTAGSITPNLFEVL